LRAAAGGAAGETGASLAWGADDVRGSAIVLRDPEGNESCVTCLVDAAEARGADARAAGLLIPKWYGLIPAASGCRQLSRKSLEHYLGRRDVTSYR